MERKGEASGRGGKTRPAGRVTGRWEGWGLATEGCKVVYKRVVKGGDPAGLCM